MRKRRSLLFIMLALILSGCITEPSEKVVTLYGNTGSVHLSSEEATDFKIKNLVDDELYIRIYANHRDNTIVRFEGVAFGDYRRVTLREAQKGNYLTLIWNTEDRFRAIPVYID